MKLVFHIKNSVQIKNHCERSIATSSLSAILDCSPPASSSIARPIRISMPYMVIFMVSCDHDLSNKIPKNVCLRRDNVKFLLFVDHIFVRTSPMIYSQDFIFAMSKMFFYNPYIRIFWRGLHFCLCMLLQIYTK